MASNNIGKWNVSAGVDAGAFTTGVNSMVQSTARAEKTVSKGFKGMEQAVDGALGGVGASLSMFGMRVGFQSLSVAGTINAMMQAFGKIGTQLDSDLELGFLSDQLGMSIETLSALQTVASENSVTADQFSSAMQRFNQTLGQANLGSEEAVRSFTQIGLSWDSIRQMRPDEQFMAVARALGETENRSVRARAAMELFGRGGAGGMLRFVQDLDRSLNDVRMRGAFLTEADLQVMERMDDVIDRMTTRWSQLWREITVAAAQFTAGEEAPRWLQRTAEAWNTMATSQEVGWRDPDVAGPDSRSVSQSEMDRMLAEIRALDVGAMFAAQSLTALVTGIDEGEVAFVEMIEAVDVAANRLRDQTRASGLLADISAADRIFEATRTPVERFEEQMEQLIYLFNEGNLSADTFGRALDQAMGGLSGGGDRRLPGMVTYGSAASISQANQTQNQIRDRMDTLVSVNRETRDALRDILRDNPEVQSLLQGGS